MAVGSVQLYSFEGADHYFQKAKRLTVEEEQPGLLAGQIEQVTYQPGRLGSASALIFWRE